MPNRATADEREKLDHSAHPTTRRIDSDLRAPGSGPAERSKDADDQDRADDEDLGRQ